MRWVLVGLSWTLGLGGSSRGFTSGAMNSGVPQKVLVVALYHMFSLQRP